MEKDTMAYQLAVLRDTQMVQRRQLEKWYPYIDWERMPFSSYGDFFRLRSIMEECGEVWTNAYGRSNEEADSTRKYLKDYSGKGREIEMFNFGWSGGSGYGLYLFNWSSGWSVNNSGSAGLDVVATSSKMSFNVTSDYAPNLIGLYKYTTFAKKVLTVRISGMRTGEKAGIAFNKGNGDEVQIYIYNDGIMKVTLDDTMRALAISVSNITDKSNRHIVIEQIPEYPGAIVSDGVDDYGQCVSGFALPSDYTVVAMREILNGGASGIINKTRATSQGAFIFEYAGSQSYSYGDYYSDLSVPKLFSYQTKASYNGTVLTPGTGTDTADDKLLIFRLRDGTSNYISAALYSFGIFSRTLTADELRTVENCMYAEWIAMTGKLEDIEYYDILDARFRSNDEAADKRDKWVGRFGKLHMTLHNYAYSQMSGWDGRNESFDEWNCRYVVAEGPYKIRIDKISEAVGAYRALKKNELQISFKVRVSGVTKLMLSGEITSFRLVSLKNTSSGIVKEYPITEDGLYSFNAWDVGEASGIGWFPYKNGVPSYLVSLSSPITIELIPDYGGALVSDGVDDYAASDENIDGQIGGVVLHCTDLRAADDAVGYAFGNSWQLNSIFGYFSTSSAGVNGMTYGDTKGNDGEVTTARTEGKDLLFGFSREPSFHGYPLYISRLSDASSEYGKIAFYQLRLIKTQPTDIQLEAIKWQCLKEHDDYLIHRGWKEIG